MVEIDGKYQWPQLCEISRSYYLFLAWCCHKIPSSLDVIIFCINYSDYLTLWREEKRMRNFKDVMIFPDICVGL